MRLLFRVGVLLIVSIVIGKEVNQCCRRKIVGQKVFNFVKLEKEVGAKFGCLTNCVYSREGEPGNLYCFANGDQQSICQEESASQPTTQEKTSQGPTTQEPASQKPTTQEPTTQEPTTQEPTTQEPTTQEPTTQEP